MSTYLTNDTDLTAVANAIRGKTGESGTLTYPSGYVSAINTLKPPTPGVLNADSTQVSAGTATIAASGFSEASSSTGYKVTLTTTPGSARGSAGVATAGYVDDETATQSGTTSIAVTPNKSEIKIPTNTIAGSVDSLTAPSVAVSGSATGFTPASSSSYYVTVSGTPTDGSVKGKATAGSTTGIVAANATNTSTATPITPTVTGSGNKVYIPTGLVTGPSSLSGSSATVTTGTNTLTLTKTGVTTTPTVSTAGYISSPTASTATVALTASVTTQAAKTVYATTSSQTAVSSGTYTTGAVTVAALSQTNLSTANIKSGTTVSISNGSTNVWSVTGTAATYDTVSSVPSTKSTDIIYNTGDSSYYVWEA